MFLPMPVHVHGTSLVHDTKACACAVTSCINMSFACIVAMTQCLLLQPAAIAHTLFLVFANAHMPRLYLTQSAEH